MRTVYPDCFVGVDEGSKRAFIISYDECGVTIFEDRPSALDVVKKAEKNKKIFTIDNNEDY